MEKVEIINKVQQFMETLTKRQREVLDFLINFNRIKGYMPTLREVADEFGVSHQAIDKLFKKLEVKGYIETKDNESRSVTIKKGINANTIQMAKEIEAAYQLYKNERITKEQYEKIRGEVIDSFLSE